jgi:hypothetical protein
MAAPDAALVARQRNLIERSQQLRTALARDAGTLVRPLNRLGAAGTTLALFTCGRGLPIAALLGLLLAWRMRGGLRVALRLWTLWRGWRGLRLWLLQ